MTAESYRSGAQAPSETHCSRAMLQLDGYRACASCGALFSLDDGELRAIEMPAGITLQWARPDEVTLRDRWVVRSGGGPWAGVFGAAVLMLLAFIALTGALLLALGALFEPVSLLFSIAPFVVGSAVAYGAASLLLNRTELTISPSHFELRNVPLLWGRPVRAVRGPNDRAIIERVGAYPPTTPVVRRRVDRIVVERVIHDPPRERNVVRWRRGFDAHHVRIQTDGDPALLFSGGSLPEHAESVRAVIEHVLRATAPRARVEVSTDDGAEVEGSEATTRQPKTKRR